MPIESPLNGVLLIDKPSGISSAACVARIKKIIGKQHRIGHAGTLDPLATGLLVVLIGKATRLQSLFLGANKRYTGEIQLGLKTSTDDIEGEVLKEEEWISSEPNKLLCKRIIEKFSGTLSQVPPNISAVKVDGQRAYALSRKDKLLKPLTPRTVTIYNFLLEVVPPNKLAFDISCSKGTYIRSLARDIGEFLGTFGCISSLRRTESDPFLIDQTMKLESLTEENVNSAIRSIEQVVSHLPDCSFSEAECIKLKQGIQDPLNLLSSLSEDISLVSIKSPSGALIAFAERKVGNTFSLAFVL